MADRRPGTSKATSNMQAPTSWADSAGFALTLARAEVQIGNTIGTENYYRYAEQYFRSMRLDPEPR